MDNRKNNLSHLLKQYLQNELSPAEYSELWEIMNNEDTDDALKEELLLLWQEAKVAQMVVPDHEWNNKLQLLKDKIVEEQVLDIKPLQKKISRKYWWVAAAAILLIASSAILFYSSNKGVGTKKDVAVSKKVAPDVTADPQPGGNKAQLTLADGSIILLDGTANGLLAEQGTAKIIKKADGQLLYDVTGAPTTDILYNTLSTPRGGQYNITLPDGSKVWLNSASTIIYPTSFNGKERKVEILGEAYFEVAKDATKPFRVKMNEMEVEVLGTHFNINGYQDESFVRTTLLEGKVKVRSGAVENLLNPGQQAQLGKNGNIKLLKNVNVEEVMAWKDGNFQFEDADIYSVMRQLARWYDLEVAYSGRLTKHFVGSISRDVNLSQVLTMLQQTGEVKFSREGKKIIVSP